MPPREATSAGEGLERSCRGWIASTKPVAGLELFSAWFAGKAYEKHRHDTYAIGVTDAGIQAFDYRGAGRISTPGEVVVLYPDEVHDGRAGTAAGFGYRIVYVQPATLSEAVGLLRGRRYPLPFVRNPVSKNETLSRALDEAFRDPLEPLTADEVIVRLAEGLLAGEGSAPKVTRRVDVQAMKRAREFLAAEPGKAVHSSELESVTGLSRYDVARQFRLLFGTSPHRYLTMRRLDKARTLIDGQSPLAAVAQESGFADQAHLTRTFKAAFGITPGNYRALKQKSREQFRGS